MSTNTASQKLLNLLETNPSEAFQHAADLWYTSNDNNQQNDSDVAIKIAKRTMASEKNTSIVHLTNISNNAGFYPFGGMAQQAIRQRFNKLSVEDKRCELRLITERPSAKTIITALGTDNIPEAPENWEIDFIKNTP